MDKTKKPVLILASFIFDLIAGVVIYYFWQPILNWYWNHRPILGVDFYNFASYIGYLARHFVFRVNGWKYIWWGGQPLAYDYPTLHAYLVLPLLKLFNLPQAIEAYMLISGFLFLFCSYLLFNEISHQKVLSVILALASAFSIAGYGSLTWGGSLPYFATQFFLPLTLWLLVGYFNRNDKRWFYLASLSMGLSFLGHPQVGFSYLIPIVFAWLIFYPFQEEKLFSKKRFGRLLTFLLLTAAIGWPQLSIYFGQTPLAILTSVPNTIFPFFQGLGQKIFNRLGKTSSLPLGTEGNSATVSQATNQIAQIQKNQIGRLITDTHPLFFIFLGALALGFLLLLVFRTREKKPSRFFVFTLPALWIIFYDFLFAIGIDFFHGGWYRVFWPFPLTLGILISFFWADLWALIKEKYQLKQKSIFNWLIPIVSSVVILIPGVILLTKDSAQRLTTKIETHLYRQQSSAFPDSLGFYINKDEFKKLKEKLIPSWLPADETNYRLYEADQRVNIWWNSLFDLPLVKGYTEPPAGDSSGGFYWTSIALTQSGGRDALVDSWAVPEEMAYNNALFLIDWYSIRFIEAEHEMTDSYNPLTSYLARSDIFNQKEKIIVPGWSQLYDPRFYGTDFDRIQFHPEVEQYLTYYQVKDELVSPIAHPTNAANLGIIGDVNAYQTVLRDLAAINLNSRIIVPLQLGKFIDQVSDQDLDNLDAVMLYAYDYHHHNQAWAKLDKYVQGGGKLLIETGSEVKQTDSVNLPAKYPTSLPEIFPIKATKKGDLGNIWELSGNSPEMEKLDFNKFGPPVLENQPWLFSQPNSAGDLKEGAKVIVANKGIPLIVSWPYGKGQVIWSGMNLPYHLTVYKNLEEARLFENLITDLVPLTPSVYSDYQVQRKSVSEMVVKSINAKGIFFREQDYDGWRAKLKSIVGNKQLNIFRAGPTFPGFMYVAIPKEARNSDFEVVFSYQGEFWSYFWQFVSLLIVVAILDRVIFNSKLVVPILRKIILPFKEKVGHWWEKEEEY